MTNYIETMKQGLAAAEVLEKLFRQAEAMHEGLIPFANVDCQVTVTDLRIGLYAAPALRQAIEQAEQKPCLKGGQCKHGSWCSEVYCQEHCEFVEQAEQAQPVTYSPTAGMNIAQRILHVGGRNNAAGYVEFGSIQAVEALVHQVLRDTAPPQRQPLTDEEIEFIRVDEEFNKWGISEAAFKYVARAIEAAHGIKEKNT